MAREKADPPKPLSTLHSIDSCVDSTRRGHSFCLILFTMLNQYDIPAYVAGQLPQISRDLCRPGTPLSAYQSVQVLADYTKRMALEHDFTMVKKCMGLIEKLYVRGNAAVRNAVENVFVFSISSMMCSCNLVEWRIVQSYMPSDLYQLYVRQVLKSKC